VGKGSFQNAGLLKAYAEQVVDLGVHIFTIDLQECPHMDSTFMGVLAGLARQQRERQSPAPRLAHVNERNVELLTTLGLDRILQLDPSPESPSSPFTPMPPAPPSEKDETARTMLEAHRHLVETNGENASKFQDVIQFLETKLGHRPNAR
jgi:anti-anti-sigma regulatory factor